MNRYKVNSILFIFITLTLTGCYSMKELAKGSIGSNDESYFLINTPDTVYCLINASFSGDSLMGFIVSETPKKLKSKATRVYVAPGDALIIKGAQMSIPVSNFAKIEEPKLNVLKTAEFLTLSLIAAIPVSYLLILMIGGGYDM